MSRLLHCLEELLWPARFQCLCCARCSEGESLCPDCREQLEQLRLQDQEGDVRSVWAYDGQAGKLVRGLKDRCVADCAAVLADGLAEVIRSMPLPQDTVLTWVTMPDERLRMRGIDHGRLLCEAVAERTGMEARALLKRRGNAHPQRGLSREERLKNLKGCYTSAEAFCGCVLLIDDVFTTGATAQICADVLRAGGASRVFVATATRTVSFENG